MDTIGEEILNFKYNSFKLITEVKPTCFLYLIALSWCCGCFLNHETKIGQVEA